MKQEKFIKKMIEQYGMQESNTSKIPVDAGYEKDRINHEHRKMTSNKDYQQLIGSLLFVTLNTRPDIAASVNILAQHVSNPTEYDWNELKRIVRYLKGTAHYVLHLSSNEDQKLVATISWRCKKQSFVALSSSEAELISLTEAAQETMWLRRFIPEINIEIREPTIIFEDNTSSQKMAENPNPSHRTKHIDIRYHYIKDYIKKNLIQIQHCDTNEMLADIMTKPLSRIKFEKFRNMLGIKDE